MDVSPSTKPRTSVLAYVVVALVSLGLGYVAGREHLKYEFRSMMGGTVEGIQKGFESAFPGLQEPVPQEQSEPREEEEERRPSPISVTLLRKGFREADMDSGDYIDALTFKVAFLNEAKKNIRAFDGALLFRDLLGNQVLRASLAINDPIASNEVLEWQGQIDYNQFMDSHHRLRNEDKQNLTVSFEPRKILFEDGSTEEHQ